MDFFKTSHSKTLLIAHLILVCKYRKKLLKNDLNNYVKDLIRTICIDMNIEIIRIESDLDHLHLLIQYPSTYSITSIVRSLKSKTTYYM